VTNQPGAHCTYLSKGASNLTFIKLDGRHQSALRFFGSGAHALSESRAEAKLLMACYPQDCVANSVEMVDKQLAFLEMTFLESAEPSPPKAWELQVTYQSHIAASGLHALFSRGRDICAFVTYARLAVNDLTHRNHFSVDDAARSKALLEMLNSFLQQEPRVPCHGDLSPGNILQTTDGCLVVIDWEDRLWGVRDYDYLYWLTFMKNSSHLNRKSLELSRHPHEISVAIVAMIVILKEYASSLAGSTVEGRMPPSARLRSVLSLLYPLFLCIRRQGADEVYAAFVCSDPVGCSRGGFLQSQESSVSATFVPTVLRSSTTPLCGAPRRSALRNC